MGTDAIQTPAQSTNLVLISLDDLETVINKIVNNCIEKYVEKNKEDELLTITQAAQIIGVNKATLWHWEKQGYYEKVRIGGKVWIRESDVNRLLGRKTNKIMAQ